MTTKAEKATQFLIRHRWTYVVLALVVTALAVRGAMRLEVRTHFSDLLPENNSVIDVFKNYSDFSSPLNVQLLVTVKRGTIFTPATLRQVMKLTEDLDLLPNVDHNSLISIASTKVRVTSATPQGVQSVPVMPSTPITTEKEALAVRQKALISHGVMGILVSPNERATLIQTAFFEHGLAYTTIFNRVHKLIKHAEAQDPGITIYPAGRVMLVGWVYHFGTQALWIFLLSVLLIAFMLCDYMRSVAGASTPLLAGLFSTIWGIGAGGWMGLNLEPLTLVVPVLLMARALSHSVQITRRYCEYLYETNDQQEAASKALLSMFAPAVLGIACDAAGLFMLMLVPIPIIQKLGLFCGTWSVLIIPTVVLLTPVMLSILPPPKDIKVFIAHETRSVITRAMEPLERGLAALIKPRWRIGTAAVMIPLVVVIVLLAVNRQVGSAAVGSPLLWPKNEFNVADAKMNRDLAGTVTMNVVWQGKIPHAVKYPATYESMREFQHNIEAEKGAQATLSIADYLPATNRLLHGGDPKWLPVNSDPRAVAGDLFFTLTGHSLTDFSQLMRPDMRSGDVVLWYKDLRASTVANAMKNVRKALAPILSSPHKAFRIRLAGGAVAMQYAMNQVVKRANWRILGYLLAVIFLLAAVTYRSGVAALFLIIPLVVAQFATDAVMFLRGVGLDVNTLPVIAVGLGVGIDYGIYLLSRMCDEYQSGQEHDVYEAVLRAVLTTGEAILFVACTMVVAVLPWYFISGLKFLADMGLMLALVMLFNAMLALVVLPLEVIFLKPKFLARVELMRH